MEQTNVVKFGVGQRRKSRHEVLGSIAQAILEAIDVAEQRKKGKKVNVRGGCEMKSANTAGFVLANTFANRANSAHLKIAERIKKARRLGMSNQTIKREMTKRGLRIPEEYFTASI